MSDIYYDNYHEGEEEAPPPPPRGSAKHIRKLVRKIIIIGVLVGLYGIFIFRMCATSAPADIIRYSWTQEAVDAFFDDDVDFSVYSHRLGSFLDDEGRLIRIESINRCFVYGHVLDGHFRINNILITPVLEQIQFTLRFTNRAVEYFVDFYNGDQNREGESLFFTLTTGHESEDLIFSDYVFRSAQRSRYNYRRLAFHGINLDDIGRLYLNIHYIGDVDHNNPYLSMVVFDSHLPLREYRIGHRDADLPADVWKRGERA